MKILTLILIFCSSISAQKIELLLPNQNADSLSITSYQITVDTVTKELEVTLSEYSILRVHHSHYRYKTSLYELDTIALIRASDSTQYEVRLLMCEGREFDLDDPYKGKIRSSFRNKKMLRLGYWMVGTEEEQLIRTVETLASLIPKREACNPKREMRQFVGHNYLVGYDGDGVYSSGIQLPSLYGSNSVMSMHEAVQKHVNQCQINVTDSLVFKIKFIVNEEGVVSAPFAFDCPDDIRENLYDCIKSSKWKSAIYDNKKVKSECTALIGFNVKDKYEYFERKSKEPKSKPKVVHIPDNALGMGNDRLSGQEEIYKIVERMPKPMNENYFEELTEKAKVKFKDKELNEVFKFVVEKDGFISNIVNLRSSDNEVSEWINVNLRKSLKFIPGQQRGKKVRVEVTYRIRT